MISRQIFGIRRVYWETFFANSLASSSSPYPGGFNPWISNVREDGSPHATAATDGGCERTPHTSHFLVDTNLMTRKFVAQAQVWRAQRTFHIISCAIFIRLCCVFDSPRLSLPLLAVHFLSYRLVHLPSLQLLLPRCGGQIPGALPLMRTLAHLPSTTL